MRKFCILMVYRKLLISFLVLSVNFYFNTYKHNESDKFRNFA
jgi:hypothetical protein